MGDFNGANLCDAERDAVLILPSDIGVGLHLGLALVSRSLLYNWLFHPAVRC